MRREATVRMLVVGLALLFLVITAFIVVFIGNTFIIAHGLQTPQNDKRSWKNRQNNVSAS
jgi:hypothetical protein